MSTDVVAEYGALEELNRRFLDSPEGSGYRRHDWIRLTELLELVRPATGSSPSASES